MTPSEIRRLAVEVMGWRPAKKPYANWWQLPGDPEDSKNFRKMDSWDPFSNLSDAFMVAEKIGGGPNCWEIGKCEPGGKKVYCQFSIWNGHGDDCFTEKAATVPEAISRAALAWLSAREGK